MTHRAAPVFGLGILLFLGAASACDDGAGPVESSGGSSAEAGHGAGGDPSTGAGASAPGGAPATAGGSQSAAGGPEGGAPEGGASPSACGAVEEAQALADGVHVVECAPLTHATNPPSSGEHYPVWAAYGEYDFALPRGYWVHNLEHGSVVVSYNCEAGCDEDLLAARRWLATLEADDACAGGPARVLLVPDPRLDVPWAASAWGYTLRANCFDADAFSAFYEAHAGRPPAPEAGICAPGSAVGRDACAE